MAVPTVAFTVCDEGLIALLRKLVIALLDILFVLVKIPPTKIFPVPA
jgi:hypothetical protein